MAKQPQRQPLSLNQRHTQILSASHSKPLPEDMSKLEARRRFKQNDFAPTFSVFSDSDSSPSPGEAKSDGQPKVNIGAVGNDPLPNFSAIADFSPDSTTSPLDCEGGKDINESKNGIQRELIYPPEYCFDSKHSSIGECSPSSGEKETDEPSNIVQEELSNSSEDFFDSHHSGNRDCSSWENNVNEPKKLVQEELNNPPDNSFDSYHSGNGEFSSGESETDEPKSIVQEDLNNPPEDSFESYHSGNRKRSSVDEKTIDQPTSGTEEGSYLSGLDNSSPSLSDMKPSKGVHENCELSLEDQNANEDKSSCSTTTHCNSDLSGEEKIVKVKIKGRRRLCKISEDNNDNEEIKLYDNEKSKAFEITDFDSPPQVKSAVQDEDTGSGNEIRDILNDLSSRLDILSIEKKKDPKNDLTKKDEFMKYHKVDPSSDTPKESRVGGERLKEIDLEYESEKSSVVRKFNGTGSFSGAPKRKEVKQVVGKLQSTKSSFSSYNRLEEGSDDDCVIVGDKSAVKLPDDFVSGDFVEELTFTLSGPKFTYKLPGEIAKMLYPHQREGLKWLWSLHCTGKGGILGDDMGLGKTMQICGFLAGLFNSKLIRRVMIVAPKTLLPHWIKELTAVGLSQKIREYFSTVAKLRDYELQYVLQDKGILLTTYDIVRNNVKSLCGDDRYLDRDEEYTWDYMILDEGHLIKNPSTQRAKSLHEIPSAHRIIISGTPLQNNLKELWALFNFCCPGLLGDKKWFKEKYEHFILRGNDKNAFDRDKRIGSAVAKELREHIQPYFLRRLKSEVFSEESTNGCKLSKKNEIIVWLRLTSCQRQLYTAFLKSEIVLSAFDSSPLAALTILKKICDHPLLLTKRAAEEVLEEMDSTSTQEDHTVAERLVTQMANVTENLEIEETHDISCKITFILALLDNLIPGGHNVLIFSQTRKMLDLIQATLTSNGFQFMRIDGTTKAADRLKVVNDFQEGRGAPIFLLTSQVGGLGLTLTKADRVIVVDPAWNPSTDNQSVDRAYRIGQTKDVVVYRLMTSGTVEEKIYRKQVYKGGLFKTATEHKEQIRYFSQQDLRELFSLPRDGGFDTSYTQKQLNEEHDHEHKMEEGLKSHVKFLEKLGIAGVSSHSLLFSKTAPTPAVHDEEEVRIARGMAFMGNSSSHSSVERPVDAGQYAFKPKDVKVQQKSVPNRTGPTEAEIKEKIRRLYQILENKEMISKLPDKGARIQRQIAEQYKELEIIRTEKESKDEIIDLDDISGQFHRVVNV